MSVRILFLYISNLSGHQKAADAVREAFGTLNPHWHTMGADAFSSAYPTIGKIVSRTYLEILRHTPALWDLLYDNPDVEAATREIRDLLNLVSVPKMRRMMKEHTPHAIVCTQALPCSMFAAEKRKGRLPIPLVAVITDFVLHAYWIHPEVDLYCVSTEDQKKRLLKEGIPATRVVVTGIPISPSFLRRTPKAAARAKFGLDPKRPTALIMGGSQGLGPLNTMVEALHKSPFQLLVATGFNRDMHVELEKRYGRDRHIQILGYTKQVSLLMDAADLLITKPGGITSSEALAKELPMLIVNPLPGQEERNSRYLIKAGVAEPVDNPVDVLKVAESLWNHQPRFIKMVEKTKQIAHPYAALEVARHVSGLIRTI